MAESLRLAAVVEDKFSAPLKKLQDQLKGVGGREHAERMKEQAEAFKKAHENVEKLTESMKRGLEPVMSSLGIGALTLTTALGGITEKSLTVGESLNNLRRLGDTLQVPTQFIKDQEALFQHFGISAAQVDTDLTKAQAAFRDFKKGLGEFHNTLVDYDPNEARRMMGMDSLPAAVEEYERYLNSIRDPVKRARLSALFLGDDAEGIIGTLTKKQYQKVVEETKEGSEKVTAAQLAAAERYEEESIKLQNRISSSWNKIASVTLDGLTNALQVSDKAVETLTEHTSKIEGKYTVPPSKLISSDTWGDIFGKLGKFFSDSDETSEKIQKGEEPSRLDRIMGVVKGPPEAPPSVVKAPDLNPLNMSRDDLEDVRHGFDREAARAEALSKLPIASPPPATTRAFAFDAPRLPRPDKEISLQRADDEIFPKTLGPSATITREASPIDDGGDTEKQTTAQRAIESAAILLGLKDVSLDAERRIADWWRKAILKGMDAGLNPDTPESMAQAAALERQFNPSGYSPARNVEIGGGEGGEGSGGGYKPPAHITPTPEAPEGGGRHQPPAPDGHAGPGNTGAAMTAAMDQLAREGVPHDHLKAAAALLVGQAQMESGLNPNKRHDGGTGYGIYGARDDPRGGKRRSKMLAWLKENGYARNSLEGQQRYMAHEAMTDPTYATTRETLMGASPETLGHDSRTLTKNFERPAVINDRSGATFKAYHAKIQAAEAPHHEAVVPPPHHEGEALADRLVAARALNQKANIPDLSKLSSYPHKDEHLDNVEGFIFHHTASHGTPEQIIQTLNKKRLGVQYVMDRNGKVFQTLPKDARGAHILPSEINNLNNQNTEGMEVIANDDADVTKAQIAAAKSFAARFAKDHPGVQFFGHGEVNPSHKQATEGHSIVEAIRNGLKPVEVPSSVANQAPLEKRTLLNFAHGNVDDDKAHYKPPSWFSYDAQGRGTPDAFKSPQVDNAIKSSSAVDRLISAQMAQVREAGRDPVGGNVNVHLHGPAAKMNVSASVDGNLFKKVSINRGATLPSAMA